MARRPTENRGSRYRGETINIPFYIKKEKLHIIRLKIRKRSLEGNGVNVTSPGDLGAQNSILIRRRAAKRFIIYYFPEFYTFLYDRTKFQEIPNADIAAAEALFEEIKSAIAIDRVDTDANTKKFMIVLSLNYRVDRKRVELKNAQQLPSFEENLIFFNKRENIAGAASQSTFVIGSILSTNNTLNDGLSAYNQQSEQVGGPIDFIFAQSNTQRIIQFAVQLLTKALDTSTPGAQFSAADTMTIYFGSQRHHGEGDDTTLAISRIEYTLIERSLNSRPLKVGYFSNIKYNKTFQDPLTLLILKNYQLILAGGPGSNLAQGMQGTPGNPAGSFFEFMSAVAGGEAGSQWASQGGSPGLGPVTSIFNPEQPLQGPKDFGNAFLNAAKSMGSITSGDIINIGDTEALEKGFKTAFSSQELKALKMKIADNPEVFKRVMAEEKNKALDNAIRIADVVSNLAETGPMGIMEKNPVLNLIFKKLGLKEVAKEVMICLLFGAPVEIGRISGAIKNSLVKTKASIYYPPDLPAIAEISKPLIKKEDFEIFAIKGGIKKAILKIIVDTLQQTVMQIIKKLSDLLKYNCPLNNPRASDFGANNINDLMTPPPTTIGAPVVSGLDYLASQRGLTPAQIREYLAALSEILSSLDICILFQRRATASPELLERILDFNEDYSVAYVRERLINSSTVMSFFYEVSQFVNVAPLCNEIANEVYVANQENITLCLTPANMPTDELADLMQLAEDGLQLDFPEINLDCPERENFINDPTITVTVPETFNMLAELVELQFIESADAIKSILLSPTMTAGGPGSAAQMLASLGDVGENYADNGWPPKIDKAILGKIIQALDKISDFPLEDCDIDIERILGFDPAAIGEVGETVLSTVQDTMSSPEFTDAIDNIKNMLRGIESAPDAPGGGGLPIFTTYKFNSQFFWNFVNYIDINEINYSYPNVSIPLHYNSTLINDARTFVSTSVGAFPPPATSASIPIEDNSYKPVEINFNFPGNSPFLFDEQTLSQIPDFSNYDVAIEHIPQRPCIDQQMIDTLQSPPANQLLDQYRDDGTTLRGCPGTHGIGSDGIEWFNPLDDSDGPPPPGTVDTRPVCTLGGELLLSKILYRLLINRWSDTGEQEPYYANTSAGLAALSPNYGALQGWRPFSDYAPIVYNQLRYSSSIIKKIPLTEMNPIMLSAVKQWLNDPAIKGRLLPGPTYGGIIDDLLVNYENDQGCVLSIAPTEADRFPIISYVGLPSGVMPLPPWPLTDLTIPFRTLGGPLDIESSTNRLAEWIYNKVMSVNVEDLQVVRNYLKIVYPRESPSNPNVFMDFQAAGDFIPKGRFLTDIREEALEQAFENTVAMTPGEELLQGNQNVYIKQFVDAFGGIFPGGGPLDPGDLSRGSPMRDEAAEIEAKHFPIVYGILVDNMFNYLVRNGVFDAAKLQSLTLFHLNDNCPADEVADLLDVDGIVKQMIDEYVEASCCPDEPPTPQRTRIRNMIKLGMYMLLIQIHVAQIVLKNIFVFAAFELDSLIENPDNFIFKFLRNQITTSLVSFFGSSTQATENMIRRDLVNYFNKKMLRQCTIEAGGIQNSEGEIVFPVGTQFSVTNEGIGFDEILDYYISERLTIGRGALNRAIKLSLPDSSPIEMKKAFLKSIPTYNVPRDTKQFLLGEPGTTPGTVPLVFGTTPRTYQVFFTRRRITEGMAGPRSRIVLWYYYVDVDELNQPVAHLIKLFRFRGTVSAFGESGGFIDRVNEGLLNANHGGLVMTGPCLSQPQIDFLMGTSSTGGGAAVGIWADRGCPGTHGTDPDGNDWNNPPDGTDDDDDGGPTDDGSTFGGSGGGGYGQSL